MSKEIDWTINICDGKYTYIHYKEGDACILRYGQPWIESTVNIQGSNAIYYLASELLEAKNKLKEIHNICQK